VIGELIFEKSSGPVNGLVGEASEGEVGQPDAQHEDTGLALNGNLNST